MPELPEVEIIKRGLNRFARGKIFLEVEIRDQKVAKFSRKDFDQKIKGSQIKQVRRRAKQIIIETDGRFTLLIHLKMTGQLIFKDRLGSSGGGHPDKAYFGKRLPHKYTKIIFSLKDGAWLYFNDLRRFGWVRIVKQSNLDKILTSLGPEPLSADFSFHYLKDVINRRGRSNIKNLLMDQKEIAGIGNIYASEILFKAKLDPRRKAADLNREEIERLYRAVGSVLRRAIRYKGTSEDSYVDVKGQKGGYLPKAYVYMKEGRRCSDCSGRIKKIKINNRGTYFCPNCQK